MVVEVRVIKIRWALGSVVVVVALLARSFGREEGGHVEGKFKNRRVAAVVDPRRETGS